MVVRRDQELQPCCPGVHHPCYSYLEYSRHHCTKNFELASVPPGSTATPTTSTKYPGNPYLHSDPNGSLQSTPPTTNIPSKLLCKTAGATHTPLPTPSTVLKPLACLYQGKPLWHPKPPKQKIKDITTHHTKSRRIIQRRHKRKHKIAEWKRQIPFAQKLKLTKNNCLINYGFCANPKNTIQTNFNTALRTHTPTLYSQPANLAYHNLCKQSTAPPGTRQLLGLNPRSETEFYVGNRFLPFVPVA
jgi:hypothetical protein